MEKTKVKILVIDDNNDNLISMKALIKDIFPDAITLTALTGETGLKLALAHYPDVILLDVVMPGMDGFEVCKKIKANKNLTDIPVVFVTSLIGDTASRIMALESGAEAFLAKPYEKSELTAQIRAMVKIRSASITKNTEKKQLAKLVKERTLQLNNELKKSKKVLDALKKSEERFKNIFESENVGKSITQPSGEIEVNQAFCDLLGYTRDELFNKKWQDLTPAKEIQAHQNIINNLLQGEKSEARFNKQYIHKNGTLIWADLSIALMREKQGNPLYFITTIIDITERKLAVEALQKSENKLHSWVENSPVCTKIVDLDFNLQYMSSAGIRDLKIDDINDFYGKPYPLYFFPDSFKIPMINNLKKAKETGKTIEQEASASDITGTELWYHSTIIPINNYEGKLDYIMVVSTDITKGKQAEESLILAKSTSEKNGLLLSRIAENYPNSWVSIIEKDLTIRFTSGQEIKRQNIDPKDFSGLKIEQIFGEHTQIVKENYLKTFNGDETSFELFINNQHQLYKTVPLFEKQNEVTQILVVVENITERKKAEEEIRVQLDELRRWHDVTLEREDRILKLKQEVNELLIKGGEPVKYESISKERE